MQPPVFQQSKKYKQVTWLVILGLYTIHLIGSIMLSITNSSVLELFMTFIFSSLIFAIVFGIKYSIILSIVMSGDATKPQPNYEKPLKWMLAGWATVDIIVMLLLALSMITDSNTSSANPDGLGMIGIYMLYTAPSWIFSAVVSLIVMNSYQKKTYTK